MAVYDFESPSSVILLTIYIFYQIDACAVNCACLAMLIGGLPLKYSFAAVHAIINEQGEYVLDRTKVKPSTSAPVLHSPLILWKETFC